MTIDIRATVTCSLGTLISASVSDDYIQGSGLIKVKGNAVISGILTPDIGTVVTFAYTKGGVTTTLPRKLRVLSSFADPFRRTTTVELGCKLTYLQDLKEPVKWEAFDDDENNDRDPAEAEIVTIPIRASSVMAKCLRELGITASSSPLSNKFSIAEFDYGAGYVQVLSDLLVSESYCGYLNSSEVLQIFSLAEDGGSGPVLDSTSIVDIGSIGVGQLPGESVVVSYSTLKLDAADAGKRNWETSETLGPITQVRAYNPMPDVTPWLFFEYQYRPRSTTYTKYDAWDRVTERITVDYSIVADLAPGAVLHHGGEYSKSSFLKTPYGSNELITRTTEKYVYKLTAPDSGVPLPPPERSEEIEVLTRIIERPLITLAAASPIYDMAGQNSVEFTWGLDGELFVSDKTETRYEIAYGADGEQINKTLTSIYKADAFTVSGQHAMNSFFNGSTILFVSFYEGGGLGSNGKAEAFLMESSRLRYIGVEEQIAIGRELGLERKPRTSGTRGSRTNSKSELELALGSATAQRRIEFSLPYAPDDIFVKNGDAYSVVESDAQQKAKLYGRVQNKLLLGNRSGMNVQTAPESLPSTPFAPVFVSAAGYVALYRTNGTSYTMDANGIVASSDLLFMGGVGTV